MISIVVDQVRHLFGNISEALCETMGLNCIKSCKNLVGVVL